MRKLVLNICFLTFLCSQSLADETRFAATGSDTCTLSISSYQGGIVVTPGEGAFTFERGEVVSVQAVADSGYRFAHWTGSAVSAGHVADVYAASTTVTVDASCGLMANFEVDPQGTRALEVLSTVGGSVVAPGEGSFSYNHGEIVVLEAVAEPGYYFVEWSGSLITPSNPVSIEMDVDHRVTANFAPLPPALTVSSGEGGRVIVPGEGVFLYGAGTEVRAAALPDPGYTFAGWTGTQVEIDGQLDPDAACVDFTYEDEATLCANFVPATRRYYVDDDAYGSPFQDGTLDHPYDNVQEAIDTAGTGDAILVLPGIYRGHVNFCGKGVAVSAADLCTPGAISQTILTGTDDNSVVVFESGETATSILAGFTISGGEAELGGGIRCEGADPIIANCLIVGNRAELGGGVYCLQSRAILVNCTIADNFSWLEGGGLHCTGEVTVINSIVSDNQPGQIVADSGQGPVVTYSAVRGGWPGEGNIDCDPRFVERGHWSKPGGSDSAIDPSYPVVEWIPGDYHLKAEKGTWNGWMWMRWSTAGPCVDAGHQNSDVKCESLPNGGRINMGAYGGTAEASRSVLDTTQ